jgi:hypothetical protein
VLLFDFLGAAALAQVIFQVLKLAGELAHVLGWGCGHVSILGDWMTLS